MLVQYGIFCIVTEKTANLGHETTVLVNEKKLRKGCSFK